MIVAIDVGLTGAVAAMSDSGVPFRIADIPVMMSGFGRKVKYHINPVGLLDLLHIMGTDVVVIERTSAMSKQGVSSMYSMGDSFGVCRAIAASLLVPVHFVEPRQWKKDMHLGKDKEQARARAIELFPGMAGELARKKDHNRAESLLIAKWFWDKQQKQ